MATKAFYSVLPKDDSLSEVLIDCEQAFNCRNTSKNQNYSVGSTYFLKGNEAPRCNLELLAKQIFDFHTKGTKFDASTSGAEWWTQVIDHRDDIGFHWDRDYGAEEDQGIHIYPNLGTVTYLSDLGGPTLVFDKVGTPDSSTPIIGLVERFTASKPLMGKHITFTGSLLHAAPSDLTEDDEESSNDGSDNSEESEDESEVINRVTFLVNIWVNHIPSQSKRFPAKQLSKMQKLNKDLQLDFNNVAPPSASVSIPLSVDNCTRAKTWRFNNSDVNYEVIVPLPDVDTTKTTIAAHDMIEYVYSKPTDAEEAHGIEIVYAEDQPSDSEGSDEGSENGSGEESGSGSEEGSNEESGSEEEEEVVEKVFKKRKL